MLQKWCAIFLAAGFCGEIQPVQYIKESPLVALRRDVLAANMDLLIVPYVLSNLDLHWALGDLAPCLFFGFSLKLIGIGVGNSFYMSRLTQLWSNVITITIPLALMIIYLLNTDTSLGIHIEDLLIRFNPDLIIKELQMIIGLCTALGVLLRMTTREGAKIGRTNAILWCIYFGQLETYIDLPTFIIEYVIYICIILNVIWTSRRSMDSE